MYRFDLFICTRVIAPDLAKIANFKVCDALAGEFTIRSFQKPGGNLLYFSITYLLLVIKHPPGKGMLTVFVLFRRRRRRRNLQGL
jgi:hypothetical protein